MKLSTMVRKKEKKLIWKKINFLLYLVLKHTIRQERPMSRTGLYGEYGMPSSHSQFMWFFSCYMFLFLWVRLRHISSTNTLWIWMWKTAISVACFSASLIVCISRFLSFIFFKPYPVTRKILSPGYTFCTIASLK